MDVGGLRQAGDGVGRGYGLTPYLGTEPMLWLGASSVEAAPPGELR